MVYRELKKTSRVRFLHLSSVDEPSCCACAWSLDELATVKRTRRVFFISRKTTKTPIVCAIYHTCLRYTHVILVRIQLGARNAYKTVQSLATASVLFTVQLNARHKELDPCSVRAFTIKRFPDKLLVSSFPDRFPRYAWTAA